MAMINVSSWYSNAGHCPVCNRSVHSYKVIPDEQSVYSPYKDKNESVSNYIKQMAHQTLRVQPCGCSCRDWKIDHEGKLIGLSAKGERIECLEYEFQVNGNGMYPSYTSAPITYEQWNLSKDLDLLIGLNAQYHGPSYPRLMRMMPQLKTADDVRELFPYPFVGGDVPERNKFSGSFSQWNICAKCGGFSNSKAYKWDAKWSRCYGCQSTNVRRVVNKDDWASRDNWRIRDLCQYIVKEEDYDCVDVLEEILMDYDCQDPFIMDHFNRVKVHKKGCWVLDVFLEYELL